MIKPLSHRITTWVLLAAITVMFLVPLAWVVVTSVKPTEEIYGQSQGSASKGTIIRILPRKPTLDHYRHVLTELSDFPVYVWNTARITAATVILVVVCSALCGYALARLPFAGAKGILVFLLLIMAVPWITMLIHLYRMEITFGLLNTLTGLILPYTALFMPMAILIMRSAFLSLPADFREAALIDGANEWRIWSRVMLPLARPSLIVVALITFISCWKEFTFAVTLNSLPAATTLAVGITHLQDEAQSWAYGTLCAAIVLAVLPLLVAFVIFQRQIVGGLAEGAFKG